MVKNDFVRRSDSMPTITQRGRKVNWKKQPECETNGPLLAFRKVMKDCFTAFRNIPYT